MEEIFVDGYDDYKSRGRSQTKRKEQPKVWHHKGAIPKRYYNNPTKNAKRGHARAKRHDLNNLCSLDQIDKEIKRLPKRVTSKLKW